jgi:outer membrane immunogenic protein
MKKYSQLSLFSAGASVAALLFASTAGFAASNYKGETYKGEMPAPCPVEKALKDGFYVGAQVGYDSYRASNSYSYASGTFASNGSHTTNATGWAGGLFAGYGQYFQDAYYLAAEILVNTSGASQSNNHSYTTAGVGGSGNSKFSANTSYGIRVLPGIKLNTSTLLYIPLGYMSASLKGTTSTTSTTAGVSASSSKSQYTGGFVYGIGLETAIYENFSLRGEYNHTNYNSFSSNGMKWSPSDNQVMLGLSYHFA